MVEAEMSKDDKTEGGEPAADQTVAKKIRRANPTAIKLAWLVALAIATLVPNTMVTSLIDGREQSQDEAVRSIAQSWGPSQLVGGPTIIIPVDTQTSNYMRIAPKTLDATVEIEPSQRHRGFFGTTVYSATIHLRGSFAILDSMRTGDNRIVSLPEKAFLAMSFTEAKGLASGDSAAVDYGVEGSSKAAWRLYDEHGSDTCRARGQILVVPIDLGKARAAMSFDTTLHLQGTKDFRLGLVAKETNAAIKSAWPSPSFIGDQSPDRTSVSSDGFDAHWHVVGIQDQRLVSSDCAAGGPTPTATIGVDLIDSMPIYRMVTRVAKYGTLFVALAFATYFLFELMSGIAISILQYALLATSLSLFALLLVSLGEFTGYSWGYAIAAALVVTQASIFTVSVVRRLRPGLGFAGLLTGLFGFLYVLLGLESLALLVGALALFVTVSIIMLVTQRIQNRDAAPLPEAPVTDETADGVDAQVV